MFLTDHRRQRIAGDPIQSGVRADHTPRPSRSEPDEQLSTNCRALVRRLTFLLEGIEQADDADATEHAQLTASLRHTEKRVLNFVVRIESAKALTKCGVQSKHAVADLLLSINRYDDPFPRRDALLLSFLRDAQRLNYPVDVAVETLAGEQLTETRTVVASGEACLRLMDELAAGFSQLDQNGMLAPADQGQLDAWLFDVFERVRATIAALAGKPAVSGAALRVKSLVLQRLLEVGDSDAHQLRIDLSRSYLSDLNAFVHANERNREAALASGSLWSTVSSKVRCWMSNGHHY